MRYTSLCAEFHGDSRTKKSMFTLENIGFFRDMRKCGSDFSEMWGTNGGGARGVQQFVIVFPKFVQVFQNRYCQIDNLNFRKIDLNF